MSRLSVRPAAVQDDRDAVVACPEITDRATHRHPRSQDESRLPRTGLGAVVGTAVLTDCVPIDDCGGYYESVVKVRRDNGTLWRCYVDRHPADADDVSDQLPFGDFAPGRWAWLLADAEPCDPIPVTGRQGVWNWES